MTTNDPTDLVKGRVAHAVDHAVAVLTDLDERLEHLHACYGMDRPTERRIASVELLRSDLSGMRRRLAKWAAFAAKWST